MADLTRMEELVLKRLLGEITPDEDNELEGLAQLSEENRIFIKERMSPDVFQERRRLVKDINYRRMDRLIKQKIGHVPGVLDWVETPSLLRRLRPYGIAVAVLVLIVIGVLYTFRTDKTNSNPPIKATLSWRWSTGSSSIGLEDMKDGTAYKVGALETVKMGNQLIIRRRSDTVTRSTFDYSVTVLGKNDIQLVFPDSTKSQVSTKSGLSFPVLPTEAIVKERDMACYGQVLFDVSHNKDVPFKVRTPKQEIIVLGTSFKVHDYKKEDTGAVFCYTGMVQVRDASKTVSTLRPSQRITVYSKHKPKVSHGDFPDATWSSPDLFFDFSDVNLDSAMHEIAPWYGVTNVQFQGHIDRKKPGTVFFGKISRYLTLAQLLSILDRHDLHFFVKGETILVTDSTGRPDHNR